MAKTKKQKLEILEQLQKNFKNFKFLIFFSILKMKTKSIEELRKKLKKEGCRLQVVKKTLIKKAGSEKKLSFLEEKEPVAIIFSPKIFSTPVKFLKDYLNEKEGQKILGGVFEERILSGEEVLKISELPSEKELLQSLVFTLSLPVSQMTSIFNQILVKFLFSLEQIKGQKEKR
jgi:large subunit ribosomal protein L10